MLSWSLVHSVCPIRAKITHVPFGPYKFQNICFQCTILRWSIYIFQNDHFSCPPREHLHRDTFWWWENSKYSLSNTEISNVLLLTLLILLSSISLGRSFFASPSSSSFLLLWLQFLGFSATPGVSQELFLAVHRGAPGVANGPDVVQRIWTGVTNNPHHVQCINSESLSRHLT